METKTTGGLGNAQFMPPQRKRGGFFMPERGSTVSTDALREVFQIIRNSFEDRGIYRPSNLSPQENAERIDHMRQLAKQYICAYIDACAEKAKTLTLDERLKGIHL